MWSISSTYELLVKYTYATPSSYFINHQHWNYITVSKIIIIDFNASYLSICFCTFLHSPTQYKDSSI